MGENFLQFSQKACIFFSQPKEFFRIVPKFIYSVKSFADVGYIRLQVNRMLCFVFSSLHFKQRLIVICFVPNKRLISVSSLILLRPRSSSKIIINKLYNSQPFVYCLLRIYLPCLTSMA